MKYFIILLIFLFSCGTDQSDLSKKENINQIDPIIGAEEPKCKDSPFIGYWEETYGKRGEFIDINESCKVFNYYCRSEMDFTFNDHDSSLRIDVLSTDLQEGCLDLGSYDCKYQLIKSDLDYFAIICGKEVFAFNRVLGP